MDAKVIFLILTFAISVLGIVAFIVALIQKQVLVPKSAASAIFDNQQEGKPEKDFEYEGDHANVWRELDQSASKPIIFFIVSSVIWLVIGSLFGLLVSFKFNDPEFLGQTDFLTFGKLRPLHLNIITYGWLSFGSLAVSLWLVPRLTRVKLQATSTLYAAGVLWNIGVFLGCVGILFGYSDGLEWLEFWWPVDILLAIAGGMIAIPLFKTIDLTILTIIPYRYKNHEGYRDHFLGIVRDMVKADNIIFATPVYWYSMSGIMKNFFDRFTDLITVEKELGRALKGKNTYLISTGSSPILPEGFEVPFRLTSEYFEMNYKQSFYKMVIDE